MRSKNISRVRALTWDTMAPDFHWLAALIRALRPDICQLFKSPNAVNLDFARWLLMDGKEEYACVRENQSIRDLFSPPLKIIDVSPLEGLTWLSRADVQQAYPLPQNKAEFQQWFYKHGVDEHALLPLLDSGALERYYSEHPHLPRKGTAELPKVDKGRQFGVNLIGYAYGQLGLGEALRMTARALQIAGVPFTIVNFPPGGDVPQNDMSMAKFVSEEAPYKFNMFCISPLETGRFYAVNGSALLNDRYNIGYWPWELSKWPAEWQTPTDIVDEAWVYSHHTYDALAPVSDIPVLIMPLAVAIGEVSPLTRKDFDLPKDAYLFCFAFDFNSSIHRKNPQGCLKAFQLAFPIPRTGQSRVGLVIKAHKPKQPNPQWDTLKAVARKDNRIRIIEETLSRPELMAMYQSCDCYLSLHRAEGYGMGIAEAILLGMDVIATGYSGNVDYCRDHPLVKLAPYSLVPVRAGEYPYAEGQKWAEPDIGATAKLMRECVEMPRRKKAEREEPFDLRVAGRKYRQRLKYLWDKFGG